MVAMTRPMSVRVLLATLLTSFLGICSTSLAGNLRIVRDGNMMDPKITIPQGTLRGLNMVTHYNRPIFGFMGVPYAQPPVGDLRFRAPVPAKAWNGTLNATSDTVACPQVKPGWKIIGNEDCLHLNVFTPQLTARDNVTLLPVMFYIIGGAFARAENSAQRFSPEFLLDKDVLLVVPNFRVGVLGFLTTGDEVSPGNYGLKDMVRALEWVHENIQYFGGDPNQVTLFGGSSGSASVQLLAWSDLTNGLIHKFIMQSGTALNNDLRQFRNVSVNYAIKFGEHLGCPTNTSKLLIDCLRGLKTTKLLEASSSIFTVWRTYPSSVWLPTPEPDLEGAVLTDTPTNLYSAGKIRDLPSIVTVVRDEGSAYSLDFYADPDLFEDFLSDIDVALPQILAYQNFVDDVAAYTAALKSVYLNDLTADRTLLLANMTMLITDATYLYPTYQVIKQQLALAKSPQYFGCFSYRSLFSHNYYANHGITKYTGVIHGDETIYLFGHDIGRYGPTDAEFSDADLLMVDTMVQLWTSFAINGTPMMVNSSGTTTWEPYSALNNYLRIGNQSDTALEMKHDLYLERMQFWDSLTKATATSGNFRNPFQILRIMLCYYSLAYIFRF